MKKTYPLLIVIFLLFTAPAFGANPSIEDVKVNHGETININYSVKGAFTDETIEAINNSIPTSFTYLVKVYRQRAFLPDKKIKTIRYNHTVKYDSLKEEYIVTIERKSVGLGEDLVIKTKDIEEMKRLMVLTENLEFNPEVPFESGYKYRVLVKAELDVIHLPLSFILDYMLFFVKLGDVETDWYKYEFTY